MLEKLSLDKCISYSNKKAVFGSKNYIVVPFLFHNRHLRTILHLPDIRQARCERKATYGNLLASHRGCSWGDLSTMRPAVMVHDSSRVFVRLVSAVVIWISVYISSITSRPWEHQVFCHSWDSPWCGRSHREKHYGFHRSHFPCNFTKKISPLGNFCHSLAGETNEWYRYFKHALWINCYCVCKRRPALVSGHLLTKHFTFKAAAGICNSYLSCTGYWMVYHRRILSHRDSLSEYGSYSRFENKMEKTRFGCDDKSGSIGFLDDTTPLGYCTWALRRV